MVRCLHESSVSGSEQSWQCSPHSSGSVSQKQMLAVPFRQNATERSDTARTAASPTFLNVRNMPIAEKCTTTCFPLSNRDDMKKCTRPLFFCLLVKILLSLLGDLESWRSGGVKLLNSKSPKLQVAKATKLN